MSRRKKYTDEFKLSVVNEYLEGKSGGTMALATKHGLGRSQVWRWVKLYKEGGMEYLVKPAVTYSGDFKVHVVEYMHQHSMSHVQTAAHFGIQSDPTVAKWERIYYEEGKEALYEERRGRSRNMTGK
ncbi:MAG: helix-turn-helix domain-containing protein, partial [Clostridia bacterium]|nr:helix-turn-helix domain-containing protein [Clostridia bacterium]